MLTLEQQKTYLRQAGKQLREAFHTPEQEQTQTEEAPERSESSPIASEQERKETKQISFFDEPTQENEPEKDSSPSLPGTAERTSIVE